MRRPAVTVTFLLAVLLSVASSAFAQSYPLPKSASEPLAICVGCPGANQFGQLNDGLPTFPYSSPVVRFVGRVVDSQTTQNIQHIGFRVARARSIRVFSTPPRIAIQIGNAVGVYNLNTFFSATLAKGTVPISRAGGSGRSPLEQFLLWDGFMYPEAPSSKWHAPTIDGQDPMGTGGPFDYDDRGLLYSTGRFGWGIASDDGRSNGTHYPKVVQMVGCGGSATGVLCPAAVVSPSKFPNTRHDGTSVGGQSIIALRVGARYYAILASGSRDHAVFDVTVPAAPQLVATRPGRERAILRYDRSDTRVAYVDGSRRLQVYSYADLVSGAAPIATFAGTDGGFQDVAFDEAGNIWAIERTRLTKLTPSGPGYTIAAFTPFGADFNTMKAVTVGAGWIAVLGTAKVSAERFHFDVRLARIETAGPRMIPTADFFRNYYYGGMVGYAEPGKQYMEPFDVQLVRWNGETHLMLSTTGLGDVFELAGGSVAPILPSPPVLPPIPPPPPTIPPPTTVPPCTCICTPPCRPPG